jgi:hypothetical protein
VLAEEEESVEQHTWNIRQNKDGNLETREELASECHWKGVTVTRKKQKTRKKQTKNQ